MCLLHSGDDRKVTCAAVVCTELIIGYGDLVVKLFPFLRNPKIKLVIINSFDEFQRTLANVEAVAPPVVDKVVKDTAKMVYVNVGPGSNLPS
jgi:voltage-gated potassium channel Kch